VAVAASSVDPKMFSAFIRENHRFVTISFRIFSFRAISVDRNGQGCDLAKGGNDPVIPFENRCRTGGWTLRSGKILRALSGFVARGFAVTTGNWICAAAKNDDFTAETSSALQGT
jgi:hypothetical protein